MRALTFCPKKLNAHWHQLPQKFSLGLLKGMPELSEISKAQTSYNSFGQKASTTCQTLGHLVVI